MEVEVEDVLGVDNAGVIGVVDATEGEGVGSTEGGIMPKSGAICADNPSRYTLSRKTTRKKISKTKCLERMWTYIKSCSSVWVLVVLDEVDCVSVYEKC